jgi:hypothetical protein
MGVVISLDELAATFTEDDAYKALNEAIATNDKVVGFTTEQLMEITGWGYKKVLRHLRELSKEGRVVRNMFPVVSLLDGKAYPTPHYFILPAQPKE